MVTPGSRVYVQYDRFVDFMQHWEAQGYGSEDEVQTALSHNGDTLTATGQQYAPEEARAYVTMFHSMEINADVAKMTLDNFRNIPEGRPRDIAPLHAHRFGLSDRHRIWKGESPTGNNVVPVTMNWPAHDTMYAITINGDPDEARHRKNVSEWVALLQLIGIHPENSVVVDSSDVTPRSYPATTAGITAAFGQLRKHVTSTDGLFGYTTGHGDLTADTPQLIMTNGNYSTRTLVDEYARLGLGSLVTVADQCFSGTLPDMTVDTLGKSTTVLSLAPVTDPKTTRCEAFIPFFREAIERGIDLDGNPFVTTFEEAFRWALMHYNQDSHEQILGSYRASFPALTTDNLEKALASNKPTVIQLSSPSCVACRKVEKDFENIRGYLGEDVATHKVYDAWSGDGADVVAQLQQFDQRINGRALPSFIYIKDGKVVATRVGAAQANDFLADFKEHLDIAANPESYQRLMAEQLELTQGVPAEFTLEHLASTQHARIERVAPYYWSMHAQTPTQFIKAARELITQHKRFDRHSPTWAGMIMQRTWPHAEAAGAQLELLAKYAPTAPETISMVRADLNSDQAEMVHGALRALQHMKQICTRAEVAAGEPAVYVPEAFSAILDDANITDDTWAVALTAFAHNTAFDTQDMGVSLGAKPVGAYLKTPSALAGYISQGLQSASAKKQRAAARAVAIIGTLIHPRSPRFLDKELHKVAVDHMLTMSSWPQTAKRTFLQTVHQHPMTHALVTSSLEVDAEVTKVVREELTSTSPVLLEALTLRKLLRTAGMARYVSQDPAAEGPRLAAMLFNPKTPTAARTLLAGIVYGLPINENTAQPIRDILNAGNTDLALTMLQRMTFSNIQHDTERLRAITTPLLTHKSTTIRHDALLLHLEHAGLTDHEQIELLNTRMDDDPDMRVRTLCYNKLLEANVRNDMNLIARGLQDAAPDIQHAALLRLARTDAGKYWSTLGEAVATHPERTKQLLQSAFGSGLLKHSAEFRTQLHEFLFAQWTSADAKSRRRFLRDIGPGLPPSVAETVFPVTPEELAQDPLLAKEHYSMRFAADRRINRGAKRQELIIELWNTGIPELQEMAVDRRGTGGNKGKPVPLDYKLYDYASAALVAGEHGPLLDKATNVLLNMFNKALDIKSYVRKVVAHSSNPTQVAKALRRYGHRGAITPQEIQTIAQHLANPRTFDDCLGVLSGRAKYTKGVARQLEPYWESIKQAFSHSNPDSIAHALSIMGRLSNVPADEQATFVRQGIVHPSAVVRSSAVYGFTKLSRNPEYRAEARAALTKLRDNDMVAEVRTLAKKALTKMQ